MSERLSERERIRAILLNKTPLEAADWHLAEVKRIVEKCAKIAEHQKEICGSSMSRQSTAQDIADNIRRAGGE